eukprot:gb/GECG01008431.1/.p1 GENE.gb/GECG01008431.1/~~gb/GECG01008431.1/.p1  ORF type:complete len:173 (+),score=3.86 gb/GECG01008431.1/:1-519(+)
MYNGSYLSKKRTCSETCKATFFFSNSRVLSCSKCARNFSLALPYFWYVYAATCSYAAGCSNVAEPVAPVKSSRLLEHQRCYASTAVPQWDATEDTTTQTRKLGSNLFRYSDTVLPEKSVREHSLPSCYVFIAPPLQCLSSTVLVLYFVLGTEQLALLHMTAYTVIFLFRWTE